jgi:ParB family chromosome partitioning protein
MELKHIDIAKLAVSPANMRAKGKAPDIANILPSVRARGVLVPLIARAQSCPEHVEGGTPDTYEIVAGLDSTDAYAPVGQQLKAWLLGGASISTSVALFDIASFDGPIVAGLFGEDSYFADVEQFWAAQNAAIEERAAAYREAGWSEVVVLEPGQPFYTWEHERRPKAKGGKVYIVVGHRGEVAFHEGYVTCKEARRLERGEVIEKPARPEVTAATNDYIDLHRHAAVRAKLASEPGVALRVAVAHMIAGSPLWSVRVEPQRSGNEAVTESVETSASEAAFDAKRREVLALLGFEAEVPTVTGGGGEGLAALFAKLMQRSDAEVLAILAVVMRETLDARSEIVDLLGEHLAMDMAKVWRADDALIDLVRDREVLLAMVEDVAGANVAERKALFGAQVAILQPPEL